MKPQGISMSRRRDAVLWPSRFGFFDALYRTGSRTGTAHIVPVLHNSTAKPGKTISSSSEIAIKQYQSPSAHILSYHNATLIVVMVDDSNEASQIENVADLQFGDEFHDIHILSNAQVAVVLQVSADSAVTRDEELHDVYRQTQKYTKRFNTMTNPEKPHQEIVDELDNLQE
jgi:hypothetical protein